MDNSQYLYLIFVNAVGDEIGCSNDDELSCILNASGPAQVLVRKQTIDGFSDPLQHVIRSFRIIYCDIIPNLIQIFQRQFGPNNLQ